MGRRRPTTRTEGTGGITVGPKKAKGSLNKGKSDSINTLAANTSKVQGKGEKDGRMGAARQAATDKAVKKAGGTGNYLKKAKQTKSNLVKVGNVYYNKNTAHGKAMINKKNRKNR